MTVFIGSDSHFNHGNISKYCGRPFAGLQAMNDSIIAAFSALRPEDTLLYLGDIAWWNNIDSIREATSHIKCKNVLYCRGNHDKHIDKPGAIPSHWIVKDIAEYHHRNQHIILSHWPLLSWNRSFHGSFHFAGHRHVKPDNKFFCGRGMDVGYDAHGKWVFPLDEAVSLVQDRVKNDT